MEKFTRFTEDNLGLQNWKRNESPQLSFQRFANTLNNTFHRCFKKIRIRTKTFNKQRQKDNISMKLTELSDMEKVVSRSTSEVNIAAAKIKKGKLEHQIYELIAEKNAKIVAEQVASLDSMDGKFNQISMWKVKNKICPQGSPNSQKR